MDGIRWMLRLGLFLTVISSTVTASGQESERINFMMYEHVPLLLFQDRKASGFVGERAYEVLTASGIDFTVELSNPRRILATLKAGSPNICTFGFFKTAERQKFVNYSEPFIQDIPQGLLIRRENLSVFENHRTFVEVLADKDIVLGNVSGVSMGYETDLLIEKHSPTTIFGNDLEAIIRMLEAARFHYTLTDEIKASAAFEKFGMDPNVFTVVHYPDMPPGSKRYFMCSMKTSPSIVTRLDKTIGNIVGANLLMEIRPQ
ncbi:MAG: transporter substrate-binding domain-containing protein [Alphaproteobacteria bacterium]|nr:transporter substrate-binding domain-containing protein [Alphaproteobacteria bacterium]